jgi:hypothetical protein
MSAVMMMWGLMPIGVVPISFLAEALGIARALEASAVVLVLVVVAAALLLPELRRIDRGYADDDGLDAAQGVTPSVAKRGKMD